MSYVVGPFGKQLEHTFGDSAVQGICTFSFQRYLLEAFLFVEEQQLPESSSIEQLRPADKRVVTVSVPP